MMLPDSDSMITQIDPKLLPPTRLDKASWVSSNEGVHERVNFDDTIWGFDLAGGVRYNKPIVVTNVKDDSRAAKAGIRAGDKVLKINDIPTETLSLQEAHDIIIESGIYIKLAVSAPEDIETTYSYYQDIIPPEEIKSPEPPPKPIKYFVCKTNTNWDLQWPWSTTKKTIYHESNCHKVPSKFETKFGDQLLPVNEPGPVVLQPVTIASRTFELVTEEEKSP